MDPVSTSCIFNSLILVVLLNSKEIGLFNLQVAVVQVLGES